MEYSFTETDQLKIGEKKHCLTEYSYSFKRALFADDFGFV